jgi:ABC-type multidrug transport system ATPase subunit
LVVESQLTESGAIAVRWVRPAGAGTLDASHAFGAWTELRTAQTLRVDEAESRDAVEIDLDLDVAVNPIPGVGGRASLAGLRIGSCIGVEPSSEGQLVLSQSGRELIRIVAREDNCLRAASLDATRLLLNGEPFTADIIRPGDVLGDGRYRWCWKGVERGFKPATADGAFSISATALALEGRVRDFTAAFRSGELTVVVGGSGSGKTTLVRMIAGILIPASGSISLQSHGVQRQYESHELEQFAADVAARVSYIPQDDAVLAELTVRQAIEYAYLLHPANRGQSRTRQALHETVTFLLQSTGLDAHSEKLVERLSGGQRRRVNLALGLVGDPDLVILDEPTTGLDFDNERRTMQLLRRLAHQGRAVVVVTHSLEAIQFADRCVVVRAGSQGAEIAAEIEGRENVISAEASIASLIAGRSTPAAESRTAREPTRMPRWRFVELVGRTFRQWINTPIPAVLAFVALPMLLGLMVRLGSGDFRKERLAIGLVAIFWLGVNQSVRDLLKDLDVIRREDLDGTSPTRQILARACFSLATATVGAVAMTAPLYFIELKSWLPTTSDFSQFSEQNGKVDLLPWYAAIVAFAVAGFMGGLFGLAIASICSFARRKAESLAVLASVIITLPQFLYSEKCLSDGLARDPEHFGYFFKTWHSGSEQAADFLSFLTVTRWTFLPLEAWMDQIQDSDIYRLAGISLGAAAVGTLIVAAGVLTISINIERGAGWIPRRRGAIAARRI